MGIVAAVVLLGLLSITVDQALTGDNTKDTNMTFNKLTPEEEKVIVHKGTEAPFTGIFNSHKAAGTYTCKRCSAPLFESGDKFESGCGWPSFDDALPGAVKQLPDADGRRTEILCAACDAHLGHVFVGERLTDKNVRHCVNSVSLGFAPEESTEAEVAAASAYFAGGCFWGTEYYFQQAEGVITTSVGYMGGSNDDPTYREVCDGGTGHAEAVEVVFDPSKTNFEQLARLFFEIHDPTQVDRQGPDVGDQYRSAVFYANDEQKRTSKSLIQLLKDKGYDVATELVKAESFWVAEDYHQDYYQKTGKTPYCHSYQKRF
jgi:peptide methionine sulfoxide reductase msrA/msrB